MKKRKRRMKEKKIQIKRDMLKEKVNRDTLRVQKELLKSSN
jgi:hypothetical protein